MPLIFISYRRSDAAGHAGRLYDRLVDRFGQASVFKDLDSMEPGADFVEVIHETVARCDALIAVIGRDWMAGEPGGGRLKDPQDWVRIEIASALKRRIRVIPVLVERATMPSGEQLPEDLQPLARRHAVELTDSAWTAQVDQLIDALATGHTRAFAPAAPTAPSTTRPARAVESTRELARVIHDSWVRGVAFSPDGTRIATASGDKTARVWDSATGQSSRA